jgi:hypothetical protein
MRAMSEPKQPESEAADEQQGPLCCDFCGEPSESVRRVALDRDYERLRTRHEPRYACSRCSERKEQERLGLERR